MEKKDRIQALLNTYLIKHGAIDLLLPDGVDVEIGITQVSKHGLEKQQDYCWVTTSRDERSTMFDRYSMSMSFNDSASCFVDHNERGTVYVI